MKLKKYTIIVKYYGDKSEMERKNYGFNPLELLGVLEFSQREIMEQIQGKIQPEVIKRKVVKDATD